MTPWRTRRRHRRSWPPHSARRFAISSRRSPTTGDSSRLSGRRCRPPGLRGSPIAQADSDRGQDRQRPGRHPPPTGPLGPHAAAGVLDWTEQVVAGCRGVNPRLEALDDRVLREGRAVRESPHPHGPDARREEGWRRPSTRARRPSWTPRIAWRCQGNRRCGTLAAATLVKKPCPVWHYVLRVCLRPLSLMSVTWPGESRLVVAATSSENSVTIESGGWALE
jgi:hypothetical protein